MNVLIQKTTKVSHCCNVLDTSRKSLLGISKKRNLISHIMVTGTWTSITDNKLVCKEVLLEGSHLLQP